MASPLLKPRPLFIFFMGLSLFCTSLHVRAQTQTPAPHGRLPFAFDSRHDEGFRFPIPRSEVYPFKLKDKHAKDQKIKMDYRYNKNGQVEVEASLIEAHWLAADSSLSLLTGRDIDGDNKIETWFYNEGPIIKSFQKPSPSENAWSTASNILADLDYGDGRWLGSIIAKELFSNLSFTVEGEIKDAQELQITQMDLQDLDYQIKQLQKNNHDAALAQELQRVSAEGWDRLLQRWNHSRIEARHQRIVTDIAFIVAGGVALKGLRFLALKMIPKEKLFQLSTAVKNNLAQSQMAKKIWSSKAHMMSKEAVGQLKSKALGIGRRFKSESEALSWLSRNSVFTNTLKKIGNFTGSVLKASWEHKGYIATSETMQFAVETYLRGYWKFSDAPVILDQPVKSTQQFMENVKNDASLWQNIGFMTAQTTLVTGVSTALKSRGVGLLKQYAVTAGVTLFDSTFVNVVLFNKSNVNRIGFDTAWEVGVGSSQVYAELGLVRWSAVQAQKFNIPKLSLVGYLFATASQVTGYAGYNLAADSLFGIQDLPPVADPQPTQPIQPKNIDEVRRQLNEVPPVIVIPVYAPKG